MFTMKHDNIFFMCVYSAAYGVNAYLRSVTFLALQSPTRF